MYDTDSIYNNKHLSLEQLISNVNDLHALLDSGYKVSRGEHWTEGYVARAIEAGELQAITRRLVTLLAG